MKVQITLFIWTLIQLQFNQQELPQIKTQLNVLEESIIDYKTNEMWGIWTMPIGLPFATTELKPQGDLNYSAANLSDYDLNSAWVEGKADYAIGEKFGFTFKYPPRTSYGDAYQFYGKIILFNGYCKSVQTWEQNSRVKTLKVYYNDKAICEVELLDTWHLQTFDIGIFFKNRSANQNMEAPLEIKENDQLLFEITDVYKGTKYKDVAISEFMAEGAGN